MRPSTRLRTRLVLMALVIVIPAVALLLYNQSVERSRSRDEAVADTLRLAHLIASDEGVLFDGVQQFLFTISQIPELKDGNQAACAELLPRLYRAQPRYINVGVINPDGTTVCEARASTSSASTVRQREWYQRALQQRTTVVGDYHISPTTGAPDVVIARPLMDDTGRVVRIVVVALGLEQLNGIASKAQIPAGATLTLTDQQRTILARFPDDSSLIGKPLTDRFTVPDGAPVATELTEGAGADGRRRLYVSVPVTAEFNTGLNVIVAIDPDAISAQANLLLRRQLWLVALVGLVAAAVALISGQLFILRPLTALRALTHRIASGDLDARAELTASGAGLSDLSGAVDTLAAVLDTHQRTLRESEQRFRQIAETVAEVFWMTDVPMTQMLYVSPAYERIWGRTCDSLRQNPRSFLEAIHPDDLQDVRDAYKKRERGEAFDLEYRIVRPDGEVRWVWDRGYPVPNPGGPVQRYVGVVEDITVRRQTNERIHLLALAIESTADLVCVTDLNDRFTFVNKAFLRSYGYSAEEVLGQTPVLLQPANLPREEALEILRQTRRGGWHGEIRNQRKDGSELIINLSTSIIQGNDGQVIGLLGVARDMTDRLRAERTIREAEERTRFALEASNVGIWEADMKSGVSYWSETCERMHGLAPGEFGKSFQAFVNCIHPDDRLFVVQTIEHATATRGDAELEYRTVWPDGTIHQISTSAHFVFDAGQPIRGVGFTVDVTNQRSLEEQLRHAQKMEAVGQLAGGIAHDFNNMLTAILGNAELALDMLPPGAKYRAEFEEIARAGERAAGLTRQLLALSRKQVLAPRILRVGEVIAGVIPMLRRLLGESIELKTSLSARGLVKADAGQIEQVLINLTVNARDAMKSGGRLTIETADVVLDEDFARLHPTVQPGPCVMIAVSDTGHGIDPATQKRVFEPFFTTKPQGEGTGLGLATVYGIVKQSGGHIWLSSEVDRGTTFKVYLPRTDQNETAAGATPAKPDSAVGHETILYVEDEDAVREFVAKVLSRHGYQVHAVGDAQCAIEFAQAHHGPIDLLFTDVVLPGMSGPTLATELRHRHPESKILFTSGYTDNAILHHGVLDRKMAFLQKPFTADVLIQRVREVLDSTD